MFYGNSRKSVCQSGWYPFGINFRGSKAAANGDRDHVVQRLSAQRRAKEGAQSKASDQRHGEPLSEDCREQRMRIGRDMFKPETGSEACASSSSVQCSL
jgi:hypothetical protein